MMGEHEAEKKKCLQQNGVTAIENESERESEGERIKQI